MLASTKFQQAISSLATTEDDTFESLQSVGTDEGTDNTADYLPEYAEMADDTGGIPSKGCGKGGWGGAKKRDMMGMLRSNPNAFMEVMGELQSEMGSGGDGMGAMGAMGGNANMMKMMGMMAVLKCMQAGNQAGKGAAWGRSSWSAKGGDWWGTGSKARKVSAWQDDKWTSKATPGLLPQVRAITLENTEQWQTDTSALKLAGYPPEAVAMEYSKENEIFSESHHILQSFCGEQSMKDIMTFEHDPECSMYPEIYQAWKQAGGEDRGMTVGRCEVVGKWAVGFGGKKNADRAAKLAMALVIAGAVEQETLLGVAKNYPDFKRLVTEVGIANLPAEPAGKKAKKAAAAASSEDWGSWKSKSVPGVLPEVSLLNISVTQAWMTSQSALKLGGYQEEGCALVYSKECDLFSEAHHILQSFCGEQMVQNVMSFDHDSEGTMYVEIYEAWKLQGGDDWPMTVAKCDSLKKWGVGFGGKKNADRAAKLALALAIAGAVDTAQLTEVVNNYPEFGRLLTGGAPVEAAPPAPTH